MRTCMQALVGSGCCFDGINMVHNDIDWYHKDPSDIDHIYQLSCYLLIPKNDFLVLYCNFAWIPPIIKLHVYEAYLAAFHGGGRLLWLMCPKSL